MLYNVIDRSFVLVRSSWPIGQARRIIEQLSPSHIIVHHTTELDAYYLFSAVEVRHLLGGADDQAPAQEALALDQLKPTPIVDALDDEMSAPAQAVVLDERRVIGFIDSTVPPQPITKARGPDVLRGIEATQRMLVTDFPSQVVVGETASLLVFLAAERMGGQLAITIPIGTAVDVVVKARRGFELVGVREGSITVTDAEETQPLQFKFKATDIGLGAIQIFVFAGGRSLGSVTIEAQVVASAGELVAASMPKREKALPSLGGATPDLMLIIIEHWADGGPCLAFQLRTRELYDSPRIKQQFEPVSIKVDPQQYFRSFFTQIQNLPMDTEQERRAAERQLSNVASNLYKGLMPEDLRDILWSLRERIHSVQIQSQEPWIPWELCKLHGWEQGRMIGGPFFCEAFAMTRWLPTLADKCTLRLRKVALVVPAGSGLRHAESEEAYIQSLGNGDRQIERIPATLEDILPALASGGYDGWHFTCHGSAHNTNPDLAELELQAGDVLRPENISGEHENVGLQQPLVFLNACQTGQGGMALTGIGGWAQRFLCAATSEAHPEYGAAAFLGTYWEIDDQAALSFARAFYTALLHDKQTIGEAAQKARQAIRSQGGPTWLAYTVFAHPLAKVE